MHRETSRSKPRRALITGASGGIGTSFATQLAALGYDLVLVARGRERLDELAGRLRSTHGVDVAVVPADLATDEGVDSIAALASGDACLEMVVNAAGFVTWGRFTELAEDREAAQIRVNVTAVLRITQAAVAAMLARGRGTIINVASISAFVAQPYTATYCGTKAFVLNFTEALNEELRGSGVVVQALCPGFTTTDIFVPAGVDARQVPRFVWLTPDFVVRCSLAAVRRGRAVCVPGWKYVLSTLLLRITPRSVARRLMGFLFGRFDKLRLKTDAATETHRPDSNMCVALTNVDR